MASVTTAIVKHVTVILLNNMSVDFKNFSHNSTTKRTSLFVLFVCFYIYNIYNLTISRIAALVIKYMLQVKFDFRLNFI